MAAQDLALFLAARANRRVSKARSGGVDRANGAIERVSSLLRLERERVVARRTRTKWHPLVTLPLAVIRRLLEHCDLLTRVALSHTCSNVFQAAIATPHLWTEFTFSLPVLPRVSHLVQKSVSLPVRITLSLRLDATTLDGLEVFAESIFPRLEYFDIMFIVTNKRSVDPTFNVSELAMLWHRINAMLSAPAPLLHSLFVALHTSVEGSYYIDHGILNGTPSNLRTCSLHGVMMSFSDPCAAFSLLETFNWVSRKEPVTLSDVCSLLKHASRLHTIGIKSLVTSQSESVELACSRQGVGLKRFCAFVQEPVDETGRHIESVFINLDKLVIISPSQGHISEVKDEVDLPGPLRISVPSATQPLAYVHYGKPKEKSRTQTAFHRTQWAPIFSSSRLVSLVVHEMALGKVGCPPSAPNLRDLCIIMSTCCDYQSALFVGPPTPGVLIQSLDSDSENGLFFDYPSLRTLCLAEAPAQWRTECQQKMPGRPRGCTCRNGCTIALADVCDLILMRLRSKHKLERLILSGIRHIADVDLSRSLQELHQLIGVLLLLPSLPDDLLELIPSASLPCSRNRHVDPTSAFDDDDPAPPGDGGSRWSRYDPPRTLVSRRRL
ncbi:hypothetical protein EXIGLDRAFT_737103 [Exidia glandulosa HHB12029]|uniref:F-box domain-containing protein n=1 Tax=Exidia glandulosa HHB12029 TaxID=1314781 RepID=A0A165J561_EXIGL|nr:hypothetical protein EXIGLDRAFT_737103 [Exidia glandulosa HHB12029]